MVVLDGDVAVAAGDEVVCLIVIPLIVTACWHLAFVLEIPLQVIFPLVILVALNLLFLYRQCKSGFSTPGIIFRGAVNLVALLLVLIFVSVLYFLGFTVPESNSSVAMIPYTYAGVVMVTALCRIMIMLVLLHLRTSGWNV